jgi:hypothetical protein
MDLGSQAKLVLGATWTARFAENTASLLLRGLGPEGTASIQQHLFATATEAATTMTAFITPFGPAYALVAVPFTEVFNAGLAQVAFPDGTKAVRMDQGEPSDEGKVKNV